MLLLLRGVLVALVALLGLVALVRVPHGALWKPAVGATEWGHVLAIGALVLALPWARERAHLALTLVALAAFVALLTPLLRAFWVDPDAELRRAFGGVPPGRRAPLAVGELFSAQVAAGPVRTEILGTDPDGRVRKVDLYGVGTGQRRPFVVAVHGGSWTSGDRTQLPGVYHWLAAQGWAVAAVDYRLAPGSRWPAPREDVLAAIAWVRARADELSIDPDRLVLFGRSAGGHIALQVAHAEPGPGGVVGVVALYPPTDLVWSWQHPTPPRILDSHGRLGDLLGAPLDRARDAYVAASPLPQVHRGGPPTLLVHGGRDELVYPEQSERMAQALDDAGVLRVVLRLPWATHGCDANLAGPSGQLYLYTLERFLAGIRR